MVTCDNLLRIFGLARAAYSRRRARVSTRGMPELSPLSCDNAPRPTRPISPAMSAACEISAALAGAGSPHLSGRDARLQVVSGPHFDPKKVAQIPRRCMGLSANVVRGILQPV